MKKSLLAAVLVFASLTFSSCGSYSAPGNGSVGSSGSGLPPSRIKFRAFVTNPVQSLGGVNAPVIDIVDATLDEISLLGGVPFSGSITEPQRMYLSPNMTQTLVFSPADKAIAVVINASESVNTANNPSIKLAGVTDSIALTQSGTIGYAAEPGAIVSGQNSGAVQVFNYTAEAVTATLPIAAAHYLALAPDGNHMLVFSDNSNSATLVATSLIGTSAEPRSTIPGFDHPVGGIFLDNGNAVVFNCGPECGGTTASVALVNIGSGTVTTIPVRGATMGLLSGTSTLYVAGTPPGTFCGSSTQAQFCGTLDIVDLATQTVTQAPNLITDGFHYLMQMGANDQLFIGSKNCTNLNANNNPNAEVRGCLSIYNTATSAITVPPSTGDVTAIQPITGRNVVYVCENGLLQMYDTGTDALQTTQVKIVGQAFDVKLVDVPSN
ncbi:MAG TPA: hypothetical protein VGF44_09420 [Terriglobales bacterium]